MAIDSRPKAADLKPLTVTPVEATVIKALLLDLKVLLFEDGSPYPRAEQTMGWLRRKGYRLRFLTDTWYRMVGIAGCLVRTGKFAEHDHENLTEGVSVIESIEVLPDLLRSLAR